MHIWVIKETNNKKKTNKFNLNVKIKLRETNFFEG